MIVQLRCVRVYDLSSNVGRLPWKSYNKINKSIDVWAVYYGHLDGHVTLTTGSIFLAAVVSCQFGRGIIVHETCLVANKISHCHPVKRNSPIHSDIGNS